MQFHDRADRAERGRRRWRSDRDGDDDQRVRLDGASNNTSWITITSGSSGTGNGTVTYNVTANTSTTSRPGTLTIAGQTLNVTQAGRVQFHDRADRAERRRRRRRPDRDGDDDERVCLDGREQQHELDDRSPAAAAGPGTAPSPIT